MRILIVAQYYTPDITAAAFRIAETAELLAQGGHEVAVVTAEPHRVQAGTEGVPVPNRESGGAAQIVRRVPIAPLQGSGLKPYLKHYLSFVWGARKAGRALIRGGFRPDIVWVSSPPLFVGLVGPALRRAGRSLLRRRTPRFVLDIRDLWPDTAVAAGQISADGRAYKIGRLLESWLYRRCDALSCVAGPMAEYLEEAAGKRVAVVYNGVSEASLPETPVPPVGGSRSGTGARATEAAPELLYAGNWGRLQGLEVLLEAWAQVCQEPFFSSWRLRLLGSGVMEETLRARIRELGLSDRVSLEPPVAKEEALAAMEGAGLLFLNLRPDAVFSYTIPSKLFDYLRSGRPIIGGVPGEGAKILEESGGNVTFAPSDLSALVAALRRAAEHYPRLAEAAPANLSLVKARFTREAATRRLEDLFTELV